MAIDGTICFVKRGRVYVGDGFACDACGCQCAINSCRVVDQLPIAQIAAHFDATIIDTQPDEDGGATDDGGAVCGSCYEST